MTPRASTGRSEDLRSEVVSEDEGDLFGRLSDLRAERDHLWSASVAGGLDDDGRTRLAGLDREVEQCWQRLRQRRAHSRMEVTNSVSLRLSLRCSGTLVRHLDDVAVRCSLDGDCPGLDREHARKIRCRDAGDTCPHCRALRSRGVNGATSRKAVRASAEG
jgi:hypothetical protein